MIQQAGCLLLEMVMTSMHFHIDTANKSLLLFFFHLPTEPLIFHHTHPTDLTNACVEMTYCSEM